jgi:hypothetical protein
VLRKRRGRDEDQPEEAEEAGLAGAAGDEAGEDIAAGPWDVNDDGVPQAERIDFGCMHVPVAEGCEVQVSMADDQAAWVTVVRGDSGLQLQAFAAPKTGGLWAEVRQEIATEVAKAGGHSEEAGGPFGVEVHARIAPPEPVPGTHGGLHPVRFLGVDGPRWFLRGVISGPAARQPEIAGPLEQVFAEVVVVRGDHPVPPRDMLEIQLPAEALQALAEEAEAQEAQEAQAQQENKWGGIDPFERGPEITETR